MPIGAIAAVGSAVVGASSASKAAKAQERSANEQVRVQEETRDMIRNDLSGYRAGGDLGRDALLFELGLGPRPTIGGTAPSIEAFTTGGTPGTPGDNRNLGLRPDDRPRGGTAATPGVTQYRIGQNVFSTMEDAQSFARANPTGGTQYAGFQATPGYQFQVDQGNASVNALAGARGGLNSGRTMQDLTRFGQGIAAQEYGNYLNRISGVADMGLNAAAMQGTASSNAAAGISTALANRGNAQAAGAIGVGNAFQGGIENVLGVMNYQRSLNAAPSAQSVRPPSNPFY